MIRDHGSLYSIILEMEKMTIVILATLSFLYSNALTPFLFQAFCSILNRRILKGADSALILVLVVKALGIEETVGYN